MWMVANRSSQHMLIRCPRCNNNSGEWKFWKFWKVVKEGGCRAETWAWTWTSFMTRMRRLSSLSGEEIMMVECMLIPVQSTP